MIWYMALQDGVLEDYEAGMTHHYSDGCGITFEGFIGYETLTDFFKNHVIGTRIAKVEFIGDVTEEWGVVFGSKINLIEEISYENLMNNIEFLSFLNEHGGAVANLLSLHPHFVDKFDLISLDQWAATKIIIEVPTFIEKFNLGILGGHNIAQVLKVHPNFRDKFNLNKLDSHAIASLLSTQPQFHDSFDLTKIDAADIATIVIHEPQLRDKLDLVLLGKWGFYVAKVLRIHPSMIDILNIDDLNDWEQKWLFEKQPQLKKHFNQKEFIIP